MAPLVLSVFFVLQCCTDVKEVKQILLKDEGENVVEASKWIVKNDIKDTSLVIPLLTHILDTEISLSISNYGTTPYVERIKALERITGEKCPFVLDNTEDALIVDFYLEWAVNKNLIENKNKIDVIPPSIQDILSSEQFIKTIKNHNKVTWLSKYKWERNALGKKLHN